MGSMIEGSSFSGLLTRVEIGHIRNVCFLTARCQSVSDGGTSTAIEG